MATTRNLLGVFTNSEAFYLADRLRVRSGESDFGVHWRASDRVGSWRVTVVHDTGDVYAESMHDREILLLARLPSLQLCRAIPNGAHDADLCAYPIAERILAGWAERCGAPDSLDWVFERLRDAEVRCERCDGTGRAPMMGGAVPCLRCGGTGLTAAAR